MQQHFRLDAPFWLAVLVGLLAASSVLCFAIAAALQSELEGTQVLTAIVT